LLGQAGPHFLELGGAVGKLSKYLRVHGKPYELKVENGEGVLRVEFYEGYVVLVSRQPGVRFRQEVALTRSAWHSLLSRVAKPTRLMEGPDFDRNQALREAYQAEQLLLTEKREMKRTRDLEAKTIAQRRRYQQAKARRQQT
jgi:hypothetical protein